MTGRYDEHDHEHYERPRRRTRPRTKERPTYDDAVEAVVTTVDRGRFTLLVDGVSVWAVKARPLGRKGVVVGDRVRVVGDVSGESGALARIVELMERTTVLRRTADDDDPVERVVVANADQLVVVTALADPEPRPRLIDRALVAAFVVRRRTIRRRPLGASGIGTSSPSSSSGLRCDRDEELAASDDGIG